MWTTQTGVGFDPPQEFDDYLIVRELGRGQMGQLYLAEDAVLARSVAIKFISEEPEVAARQRFLMEARAAARIQHPNVVGIYRVGELGDRPYIVSELIRGSSLADLRLPMPWPQALGIAVELARGLAAAHRRGVVHCDIKPSNAMVTHDGVPKLVDFGLARLCEGDGEEDGGMVGTPDYMAPEVWSGRAASRRSDVYSFGALLFELVSGAPPFAHVEARKLMHHVREEPAPSLHGRAPDVDPRLARVVARCLQRDPEERYASGEELREALEQVRPRGSGNELVFGNPYRGLRTFEAEHRGLFFGRGLEVGEIVERLRAESVVIATGDSGVGKSSLLRAGVVPAILDSALDSRGWEAIAMVPGRRPLVALATALGDPSLAERMRAEPETLPRELGKRAGEGRGIVLFVDQLEELVTVGDPDDVAAFEAGLARLSEGVPGVKLVATVRADFLSRIAALPRLGRELSRLLYFVAPLPPERIRDVITGPANATGVVFESEDMIAELVDATAQAAGGGLPLLSFALAELWEAHDRDRGVIPKLALATMGGVAGALARHGDATLAGMAAPVRAHARRALLRLVTSEGTRVRRSERELSVGAGTRAALDALVKGRLLVVHDGDDGATYELAHEVLVRGWGTLRTWLDADLADRARRERVAAAAAEWQRAGRPADLTWRGQPLAEAHALDPTSLTVLEKEFVAASQRAERRRRWLVRAAVLGVALALVIALAIQRRLAHDRLADAIDEEVGGALDVLTEARTADRMQSELSRIAFAKFDAGDPAGEDVWKRVLDARARASAAYRTAGSRVEAALAKDPSRDDVRLLLADVLFERALLAEVLHDDAQRDELVGRLATYDTDGSRRAAWARPGMLLVHAPAGVALRLDSTALAANIATEVAPGSYVITATTGRGVVRLPILIGRGETAIVDVPAPTAVPDGFVHVPAGSFLFGSAADEDTRTSFFQTAPLHRRTTGAFLIARTETTVGEWLEYVRAQPEGERVVLLPKISGASGGLTLGLDRIELRQGEVAYAARAHEPLVYAGRARRASHDWLRLPITGISARDAAGYLGWLAKRVPGARLCTELEWERAARGADARTYPHGDRVELDDIAIDVTYGREYLGPDAVGSHPRSASPFGLHDMAGNAFEWTRGERGDFVARGGSFYHDRKTANLTNRYTLAPDARDASLGMRVCADVVE